MGTSLMVCIFFLLKEITGMCQSNGMMTADNFVANRRAKWERAHCVDAVIEAFRCFDTNDGGFVDCAIIKVRKFDWIGFALY